MFSDLQLCTRVFKVQGASVAKRDYGRAPKKTAVLDFILDQSNIADTFSKKTYPPSHTCTHTHARAQVYTHTHTPAD